MCSSKISKRSFLKGIGLLAILGMVLPWFRREKEVDFNREYPMDAAQEPNAVARGDHRASV